MISPKDINQIYFKRLKKTKDRDSMSTHKNSGRDWFKYYMFQEPIQGLLYFLELNIDGDILYKVGITKNTINERFNNLPDSVKIIKASQYRMQMVEASLLESYIHHKNHHTREFSKEIFSGMTECYFNNPHNMYLNLDFDDFYIYCEQKYGLCMGEIKDIITNKQRRMK